MTPTRLDPDAASRHVTDVILALEQNATTHALLSRALWQAWLNVDTFNPEYVYSCKECGAQKKLGHFINDVEATVGALQNEFTGHRCLQHVIKCIRCSTNQRMLSPHAVSDEMVERQAVLWSEELLARQAGTTPVPPVFNGLIRAQTDLAWVEMNPVAESSYFNMFACGPMDQMAEDKTQRQYARVTIADAKMIRATLDAWIYARESIPTAAILCDKCKGSGRVGDNRRNRLTCVKCLGMGRTLPGGEPLPYAGGQAAP